MMINMIVISAEPDTGTERTTADSVASPVVSSTVKAVVTVCVSPVVGSVTMATTVCVPAANGVVGVYVHTPLASVITTAVWGSE